MNQTEKVAANLRAFQIGVTSHDRENPEPHPAAFGIGLSMHDMERLGFDEGETILPGITVTTDSGVSGNFRVLCGGQHEGERPAEAETVDARARDMVPAGHPEPGRLAALTGRQTHHPVTGEPIAGDHGYVLWDREGGRSWMTR